MKTTTLNKNQPLPRQSGTFSAAGPSSISGQLALRTSLMPTADPPGVCCRPPAALLHGRGSLFWSSRRPVVHPRFHQRILWARVNGGEPRMWRRPPPPPGADAPPAHPHHPSDQPRVGGAAAFSRISPSVFTRPSGSDLVLDILKDPT